MTCDVADAASASELTLGAFVGTISLVVTMSYISKVLSYHASNDLPSLAAVEALARVSASISARLRAIARLQEMINGTSEQGLG